jgi:hypothetical protein
MLTQHMRAAGPSIAAAQLTKGQGRTGFPIPCTQLLQHHTFRVQHDWNVATSTQQKAAAAFKCTTVSYRRLPALHSQ